MEKRIKLITYNVDGLPEYIDLKYLPWYLKFITLIYYCIKGTTKVKVNDNDGITDCIKRISSWLNFTGSDIICVQEDFDYHDILVSDLINSYNCGTHEGGLLSGGIDIFPYPRLNADGLGLMVKNDRVKILDEDCIKWNKSYGYFTHANDKLTKKGFRFYCLLIDDEIKLDLYVVHMDADFYDPVNCPDVSGDVNARKHQLIQVVDYIKGRNRCGIHNPIIIIGDTNSSVNYEWDVDNIRNYLMHPINVTNGLCIYEAIPNNMRDVDRVFYINDDKSDYYLLFGSCEFGGDDVNGLSDHRPLISEFSFKLR